MGPIKIHNGGNHAHAQDPVPFIFFGKFEDSSPAPYLDPPRLLIPKNCRRLWQIQWDSLYLELLSISKQFSRYLSIDSSLVFSLSRTLSISNNVFGPFRDRESTVWPKSAFPSTCQKCFFSVYRYFGQRQ